MSNLKIGITSAGNGDLMGVFTHTAIDSYFHFIDPDIDVTIIDQTWDHKKIKEAVTEMDGIFMPGGLDIWPGMYGETEIHERVDPHDPLRDHFEYVAIETVLENDIPFLGVCRASQMINVYHGGTLYQDLEDMYPELSPKQIFDWKLISRINHNVTITDGPLVDIYGKTDIGVNTGHHQAVKDVGEGLKVCAIAEDGLIEGTYRPDKTFFVGIQWHPEFMFWDENSQKIMNYFVDVCKKKAGK